MVQGLIFDIQRCSLHDGPGIRTTVFLKGCPLRCQWCHNPESIGFAPEMSFNPERCLACQGCVETCPQNAHQIELTGKGFVHTYDRSVCQVCGQCAEVCPGEAVRLIGKPMSVAEVMTEIVKDRAFYTRSGGGLTISGGEPMAQFEFTYALLQAARAAGIHTCLESSGVSSPQRYAQVRPLVDIFLLDYKATNPARHRQLVGVDNALIHDNLRQLDEDGAAIILRCPLVPGINDDDEHLQGVAQIAQQYPRLLRVEIMAYHNMGVSKSVHIGQPQTLTGIASATPEIQADWITRLHALGCTSAVIG